MGVSKMKVWESRDQALENSEFKVAFSQPKIYYAQTPLGIHEEKYESEVIKSLVRNTLFEAYAFFQDHAYSVYTFAYKSKKELYPQNYHFLTVETWVEPVRIRQHEIVVPKFVYMSYKDSVLVVAKENVNLLKSKIKKLWKR